MLIGIVLRTFWTHTITVVWIVNLITVFVFWGSYSLKVKQRVFIFGFLSILLGIITFVINYRYLDVNLKSIGTNVNIIIIPFFLFIIERIRDDKPLADINLNDILFFLSIMGLVSIVVSWVIGYSDIIRVFQGRLNVYRANNGGLFYGKNIYGSFVSLSLCADLYLYKKAYKKKSILLTIIIIKVLALIVSFSRAAMLQAAVAAFMFLWFNGKRSARDWVLLGIVAAASLIIVLSNQTLYDFFVYNVLRLETGDAGRAVLRRLAVDRVDSDPLTLLFGVGYAGIDSLNIDIDNTYLYIYFSGGLFKILFYLVTLFVSVKRIIQIRIRNLFLGNLCMAVTVSYFVFAFFESVAVLELGLLNFLYTFFMFIVPSGYDSGEL